MYILGINIYHPDSSACIIKDGQLVAAAEEERFKRIKHWAGLPKEAIRFCLENARIDLGQVDYIGISRNPSIHIFKKILFVLRRRPKLSFIKSRIDNLNKIKDIKSELSQIYGFKSSAIKAKIFNIEHHRAHMASTFFVSGFDEAAVLSVDALGDFVSTMCGYGRKNNLKVINRVFFPHSLGFLYTAGTQFLGFLKFGDEYKVMGLAAYGEPCYLENFKKILRLEKDGKFELNPAYFRYYSEGIEMSWYNQEPRCARLYSDAWGELFGPHRGPGDEIAQRHRDIASSLQAILEECYFHILNNLYTKTKIDTLCMCGGVALNCVANGKILDQTPFKKIYMPPAPGDAGTAIGAAYYIYHQILRRPRSFVMGHAYWGPEFKDEQIELALRQSNLLFQRYSQEELIKQVAQDIASGKIVGWFQGRMEWGPRALGNRSILADPRKVEMRDILNNRVKHRESFRPFAPSILIEDLNRYISIGLASRFMLFALPVKKDEVSKIIATVHIDDTVRLQTVDEMTNPLYWRLIKEFKNLTDVPAVLNTSFNENEPIVLSPNEAIGCFLRTKMDVLVMGNFLIHKSDEI